MFLLFTVFEPAYQTLPIKPLVWFIFVFDGFLLLFLVLLGFALDFSFFVAFSKFVFISIRWSTFLCHVSFFNGFYRGITSYKYLTYRLHNKLLYVCMCCNLYAKKYVYMLDCLFIYSTNLIFFFFIVKLFYFCLLLLVSLFFFAFFSLFLFFYHCLSFLTTSL